MSNRNYKEGDIIQFLPAYEMRRVSSKFKEQIQEIRDEYRELLSVNPDMLQTDEDFDIENHINKIADYYKRYIINDDVFIDQICEKEVTVVMNILEQRGAGVTYIVEDEERSYRIHANYFEDDGKDEEES